MLPIKWKLENNSIWTQARKKMLCIDTNLLMTSQSSMHYEDYVHTCTICSSVLAEVAEHTSHPQVPWGLVVLSLYAGPLEAVIVPYVGHFLVQKYAFLDEQPAGLSLNLHFLSTLLCELSHIFFLFLFSRAKMEKINKNTHNILLNNIINTAS